MFTNLEDLLLTQAIASAIILLLFAGLLAHKGLFHWTTAGFWSWTAFAIYFCLNPLASIFWNLEKYRLSIQLSGGLERALWIGTASLVGMTVFFASYLRTKTKPATWNLHPNDQRITAIMALIIVAFVLLAALSLFTYHQGNSSVQNQAVLSGRFTSEVTGYQYIAHLFVFIPVAILLLSRSRFMQILGFLIGIGYIILRMPDEWGRWSVVSMLLAMSLIITLLRKSKWPPAIFFIAIIIIASVLTVREHTSLTSGEGLGKLVSQIPEKIGRSFAKNNTDMLAFWYIDSYIKDEVTGYDWGIPFLNYALTGFIPTRILPQKYFMIDWLTSRQPQILNQQIVGRIFGSKPTLFGSFYGHGGIIGLVLLAWFVGILLRKMDGMLSPESPAIVKAMGVMWMSALWMVWGSQDTWGLMALGSLAIPTIALWIVAPKAAKPV